MTAAHVIYAISGNPILGDRVAIGAVVIEGNRRRLVLRKKLPAWTPFDCVKVFAQLVDGEIPLHLGIIDQLPPPGVIIDSLALPAAEVMAELHK